MSKKSIQKVFLGIGILLSVVGIKVADKLSASNFETALVIGIISVIVGFFCTLAGIATMASKAHITSEKNINDGVSPVYITDCTHISGLTSFTAETELRIYVDKIHFTVAGTHYNLPIERIRSADILTQKQTETVLNTSLGRTLLATLIFGELGALISIERSMKEKEITTVEENLVITYEKDGEAKFIVLKNLPCDKVIQTIKKLVPLTPRHVEL